MKLQKFITLFHHDIYKSVHHNTTMKITNKMHYIDLFIIPSRFYMFRAKFSSIIRSSRLYLQYLVVFTKVAWVNTTRYCKYTLLLLMMGENMSRNM